jgi:hypothetical protein
VKLDNKNSRHLHAHSVFKLGWSVRDSDGWWWRIDGGSDPFHFWHRWRTLRIHLGFCTLALSRDEKIRETKWGEFTSNGVPIKST